MDKTEVFVFPLALTLYTSFWLMNPNRIESKATEQIKVSFVYNRPSRVEDGWGYERDTGPNPSVFPCSHNIQSQKQSGRRTFSPSVVSGEKKSWIRPLFFPGNRYIRISSV